MGQMMNRASGTNVYISIHMFYDISQTGKVTFYSQAVCLSFLCKNGKII